MIEMIVVSLLVLTILGLAFFYLAYTRDRKGQKEVLTSVLGDFRHNVSEAVLKHTLESREAITKHLNDQVSQFQRQFQEQLGHFRKEVREEMSLNRNELGKNFHQVEKKVDARLQAITSTVQEKLDKNISEGFKHFEQVQKHLKSAEVQLLQLGTVGSSIVELNSLLKLPHLRGGFGETTLELLLENFFNKGTYELQFAVTPQSRERVDAAVKVNNLWLPIDSKFPRERVLPLFEVTTSEGLAEAQKVLADALRTMAKDIAEKYIKPEHGTTDYAFLFLPSETLYFEAIRNGKCWEQCLKLKVFPVSPNTLAATLHAMKKSMDFQELALGVEKTIGQIQKAQKHFENFNKKFDDVGKGLHRAQDAFNTAYTHLGRYSGSVTRLTGADDKPAELPLSSSTETSEASP